VSERPTHPLGDLASLPTSATGPAHLVWWGNFGFMLIEGTAFVLAAGAYLYLMARSPAWPPAGDGRPDLLWGTIFTLTLLTSEIPNLFLLRKAKEKDARATRLLALTMVTCGLLLAGLRAAEFAHLNVRWDQDAYGSVVWMLMVLHTTHIVTELGETGVQTLWLFTHEIGDDQFADMEDDSNYWTFVVLAWLPIYVLVYWLPRLG
jgi:heme/copper-type cytochrome/quinol oxidase subunit 3